MVTDKMEEFISEDMDFLLTIFNALPDPTMIVDHDVRIILYNKSASELLVDNAVIRKRAGEVLHCVNSLEKGCGRSEFCKDCVIRNSVSESVEGAKVYRKQAVLNYIVNGKECEAFFLITTAPFIFKNETFIIITLEDINEVIQLKKLIPICSRCKRIRNDKDYWESVESYISEHLDVYFSHSICPDCLKELYPEIADKMDI